MLNLPLRRLAAECGHVPARLRRRLPNDAILRARYIAPLIRLWAEETYRETRPTI